MQFFHLRIPVHFNYGNLIPSHQGFPDKNSSVIYLSWNFSVTPSVEFFFENLTNFSTDFLQEILQSCNFQAILFSFQIPTYRKSNKIHEFTEKQLIANKLAEYI